ncbi:MAG: alpha/beta hydrolase [Pseudomonadales bacterium]|nr:alpha/beta hydrolase [Pseudomonadales bacterium]MBO6565606.1 alpha/beta hydrolase [Pseudomonadales bacterium]MBO6595337.1 alpha/beta hydrolase [Pseudomonadales bacterium]MBO6821104.1 alpha/beta hydrolase [Pseudomonadales bacterium]
MNSNIFLFLLYVMCGSVVIASVAEAETQSIKDETFGFNLSRDVPYVEQKLDQSADLRTLDVYSPLSSEEVTDESELLPIVLYVHGGGWAFGDKSDVNVKPHYFIGQGFGFVSMNYRLRWDYKVYDQVVDLVTAMSWLAENAHRYGLDANRVVVMGHASGGHLATLVTADSSYFYADGFDPKRIKAIVSIDSSSYDITRLMRELGSFVERRQHQLIFTADESVWAAASPITHVSSSTTLPPHALLFNPEREASALQAKGYAKALTVAGVEVVLIPGSESAPDRTDELIGVSGNLATIAMIAFIRSQI